MKRLMFTDSEKLARRRELGKIRAATYREKHPGKIKERNEAHYQKNKYEIRVRQTKAYAANPERWKESNLKSIKKNRGCVSCRDWPDWREGWKHYDGHCYRCFSHKFPGHAKVHTKQRVEYEVRAFINAHFQDFVHDQKLPTAHCNCNHRRRIDHRRVVGNTLLCIETDEHHHRNYDPSDEDSRYHDVLVAWGGKLCFVRINPDGKGPAIEERLERLHAEITRHIGRLERGENSSYLEVWHLYYPKGTPDFYEEEHKPEWMPVD